MTLDGDKPKEKPQNVALVGGANLTVDDSDSDDEPVVDMEDYIEDDDPVSYRTLLESSITVCVCVSVCVCVCVCMRAGMHGSQFPALSSAGVLSIAIGLGR